MKFNGQHSINLSYQKKNGVWELKSFKIDKEFRNNFGKTALAPLRKKFSDPWVHTSLILEFLGKNHLGGGGFLGEMSDKTYSISVEIKETRKKYKG